MQDLSIGEVAKLAGVQPSALRFYERAGVIPKPARINGRRRYSAELVRLITIARFAQSVGFSLEEIRLLFSQAKPSTVSRRWRPIATAKVQQLEQTISRAKSMKKAIEAGLQCGCIRVEDCIPTTPKSARNPGRSSRKA